MRTKQEGYINNEIALMLVMGLIGNKESQLLTIKTKDIKDPNENNEYTQKAEMRRLRKMQRNLKLLKK